MKRDPRIRFWDEHERAELVAELEPIRDADELPRPEVGDRDSREPEPDSGYDDAPAPELEPEPERGD